MNSLRDEMKDHIRGALADYHHISESEVDADLVADLADVVFDVAKMSEDVQDDDYPEYEKRRDTIR